MKQFTILLLLNATPNWLRLSRNERNDFFTDVIAPILAKVSAGMSARFYDSEYFHSSVSDFLIIEAIDMKVYQLFIEMLRDTKVYSEPYFEVKEIIVGQENAYQEFDKILNPQY